MIQQKPWGVSKASFWCFSCHSVNHKSSDSFCGPQSPFPSNLIHNIKHWSCVPLGWIDGICKRPPSSRLVFIQLSLRSCIFSRASAKGWSSIYRAARGSSILITEQLAIFSVQHFETPIGQYPSESQSLMGVLLRYFSKGLWCYCTKMSGRSPCNLISDWCIDCILLRDLAGCWCVVPGFGCVF